MNRKDSFFHHIFFFIKVITILIGRIFLKAAFCSPVMEMVWEWVAYLLHEGQIYEQFL